MDDFSSGDSDNKMFGLKDDQVGPVKDLYTQDLENQLKSKEVLGIFDQGKKDHFYTENRDLIDQQRQYARQRMQISALPYVRNEFLVQLFFINSLFCWFLRKSDFL